VEEFTQKEPDFVQKVYIESELLVNEHFTTNISGDKLYIVLPYCMRQKDQEQIEKLVAYAKIHDYNGFLVRNVEEYAYLKSCNYEGVLIGDAGLYVWNSYADTFWKQKLDVITCPYELNKKEYKNLFHKIPYEKVVYGRLPMMITANCIRKTMKQCVKANGTASAIIKDRYHKEFPVVTNCQYCYNVIYNSPLLFNWRSAKSNSI
jgi:putative protease